MSQPTTAFSIEGTVHKVFETEQKGASFSVRNFVLEVAGQYPQLIQFQLTQDRCALIDKFSADEPNGQQKARLLSQYGGLSYL